LHLPVKGADNLDPAIAFGIDVQFDASSFMKKHLFSAPGGG